MRGFLFTLTKLWSWIWRNFEVWRCEHEAQFQFYISEQCKKTVAVGVVCVWWWFFFKLTSTRDAVLPQVVIPVKSSGNTWRDFLTECVQPRYQLTFLLAAQVLLLWKSFDIDLLEIVNVVACLCKSWPFIVAWNLLETGY